MSNDIDAIEALGKQTCMRPNIETYHDRVVINGVTIYRPTTMSPSQWMAFWERK